MSKEIGKRIKLLRKKKGLKQDELAAAIGLSPSAVSNYEQGTRVPKEDTLKALVEVLDSTPDYILWGIESSSSRPILTAEELQMLSNNVRELIIAEPSAFAGLSNVSIVDISDDDLQYLCGAVMHAYVKVLNKNEK